MCAPESSQRSPAGLWTHNSWCSRPLPATTCSRRTAPLASHARGPVFESRCDHSGSRRRCADLPPPESSCERARATKVRPFCTWSGTRTSCFAALTVVSSLGPIDRLWASEAKRRRDEVRSGRVKTISGVQARRRVRGVVSVLDG
ncbi:MAG: addiction module protein [Deltaproteobacteria bacterium]|nr:addiction module protein [Deltaproteobacteria bacterium]